MQVFLGRQEHDRRSEEVTEIKNVKDCTETCLKEMKDSYEGEKDPR